jgi:dipeptidyl-peptidase-4
MIKPSDFDETKEYPVLVYLYNGPHVQLVRNTWMAAAPLWMHSLAEDGFIIFTVDGRGSANRGIDFEQAVFRNLGDLEMEDQIHLTNWLKEQPYTDEEKFAIHGWSYGGFMTTSLMLRKPGNFKVGVAGGPVIDWKYYEVMYTERYMDTPETNPEGFEKAALPQYVENLEGKLLSIHGTSDDVVVLQHNMALLKASIEKGVQIDFMAYPGHPHNVHGKDRVHLMTKIIEYIKANL